MCVMFHIRHGWHEGELCPARAWSDAVAVAYELLSPGVSVSGAVDTMNISQLGCRCI